MRLPVTLAALFALSLIAAGPLSSLMFPTLSAAHSVQAAQQAEDPEMQERVESSPLEELDPREATWQTWIGPILIAIFALILVFLIRRFSRAEANRDVDPPDAK